jgi:2-(1,2-epoxy-1,2-dihydrophenyl)acetyl-CoA isomerase
MPKVDYTRDSEYFSASQCNDIVTFGFKQNRLMHASLFEARDAVLGYLEEVSRADMVKVVIIMGNVGHDDCDQYRSGCSRMRSGELPEAAMLRMFRAVDRLMLTLVGSSTMFVGVSAGETVPLLLGVNLACDYRLAGESLMVHHLYQSEGMLPKGGLPFFFGRRVGRSRALEWLMLKDCMQARDCLDLGLVDRVVPDEHLEATAQEIAQDLARYPKPILARFKRLLNCSLEGLPEYLEEENRELCFVLENASCLRGA